MLQQEVKQATSNSESLQNQLARKMKLPIFVADAFTTKAFRGNPAAVCLLENVSTSFRSAVPEILDCCRTKYFLKKKKGNKVRPTCLFIALVCVVKLCQQYISVS